MYRELKKYKTGDKIKGTAKLVKFEGGYKIIDYEYDEYRGKLGDIIEDFIKHEKKPWWRRGIEHDHVRRLYKKFLNEVEITIGL